MSFNPVPLNPHAGEPREQLLQRLWDHRLSDAAKARVLAEAKARGCQWLDILRDAAAEWDALMHDPVERVRLMDLDQWKAMPFGPDPLSKDGER